MPQIDLNQNWMQIAKQIYETFEVFNNITIGGAQLIDGEYYPIGKLVCEELERLDRIDNTAPHGNGKNIRRKRYKPNDWIGGYVSQKAFKFKEEVRNGKLIYTIWRMQ